MGKGKGVESVNFVGVDRFKFSSMVAVAYSPYVFVVVRYLLHFYMPVCIVFRGVPWSYTPTFPLLSCRAR